MNRPPGAGYHLRIREALKELAIPESLIAERGLPVQVEARRLAPVGLGTDGRDKLLAPAAAQAWLAMRQQAGAEGITLLLVSGFRSFDFQLALLRAKLRRGLTIEQVLQVNAPPGFSEHHTGRAVDIGAAECPPLEKAFDQTAAYRWLRENAGRFRFSLSYPKDNRHGFAYEPWHWCYR